MFRKIISGMVDSEDPDQTAPEGAVWSGSTQFTYAILSEILVYCCMAFTVVMEK